VSDLVTCEIDPQGIAILRLNRPEKANGFNLPMIAVCAETIEQVHHDPAVKAIVLTGTGRAFCSGGDIEELAGITQGDAVQAKAYLWEHIHRIPLALERCDKPVIAAVNGAARGAGMDIALMCDVRFAAESASFAQSYIDLGVIPGDGGAWFLPRLVGTARALEMIWTGDVVSAVEAERMGLINRVVPDDVLLATSTEFARRVACQPEQAVRLAKRMVLHGLTTPLAAHLDAASSHMAVIYESAEFRERLQSVLARLKARGAKGAAGGSPAQSPALPASSPF
jgi:enoyl-CoA hydratase/carnithine racemase